MDFDLIVVVGFYTKTVAQTNLRFDFCFKLSLILKEESRMGVFEDRVLSPRRK